MKNELSRRTFLKGAATVAAAAAVMPHAALAEEEAPAAAPSYPDWVGEEPEIPEDEIQITYDTEVLVIGSGTAGWPAFASALENGAQAMMIERLNVGTPKGDIGSIGSKKQLESIEADPDLYIDKHELIKDLVRYSANDIDARLWYVWADESAELVDWYTDLLEKDGYYTMWHEAGIGNKEGGNRDKAYATGHSPAPNGKDVPSVSEILRQYTEGLGGQILEETVFIKFIKEDGRVVGALCQNLDDEYIRINASKGVILTTGGYCANEEMLAARQPMALKLASRVGSADNGSGIKAAIWAGAKMQESALSMFFNRTAILPDQVSGREAQGKNFWFGEQPFLKVNLRGERFTNESGLYEYFTHAVKFQPDYTYCDVWDSTYAEDCERFEMVGCSRLFPFPNGAPSNWTLERAVEGWQKLIEDGYVQQADTLEELAEKLNIPADTFVKTVERYNELEAKGHDDDFGKVAYRLSRMDTPPYYGVRASAWHLTTLDGVLIDTDARVLDEHMDPIPGLYAAGDVTGGRFAHVYPNLCTGLACGCSMTFGRRAGRIAAQQ